MKKIALFGHPVAHSVSPKLHQRFAESLGIELSYTVIDVERSDFPGVLADFRKKGGEGANVTLPLKEDAFRLCDKTTDLAKRAQAVNTLYWDEHGKLCGDNTDGVGFVRDLTKNHQQSVCNKRILLIGAGGAAAGILGPLLDLKPSEILLANRSVSRANDLSARFKDYPIQTIALSDLARLPSPSLYGLFDIVINATSASLTETLIPLDEGLIQGAFVADLVYRQGTKTVFLDWAMRHGASYGIDGTGMLMEQAAESFAIWCGARPDVGAWLGLLRE